MEQTGYISCQDLMEMETLKGIQLAAGKAGMNHPVDRVNIMEVPDIADWSQSNEFLMTTGYAFMEHKNAFVQLIPKLKKKGIAALGIKPNRFLHEISKETIAAAEEAELPLFILPPATVFSNVVKEVMEKICAKEASSYPTIQNRVDVITRQLLSDSNLLHVLDSIEDIIGNPLALADEDRNLICHDEEEAVFQEMLLQIPEKNVPSKMTFRTTGVRKDILNLIPLGENRVFPILLILEKNHPVLPVDSITIGKLTPYIQMKLTSEKFNQSVKAKYMDAFLQDWVNGYIKNKDELKVRAESFDLGYIAKMKTRLAVVLEPNMKYGDSDAIQKLNEKNHEKGIWDFLFVTIGSVIACIFLWKPEESFGMEDKLQHLDDMMQGIFPEKDYQIFLGRQASQSTHLKAEYLDCLKLMKSAEVCREKSRIVTWKKIGVYAVLTQVQHNSDIDEFLNEYIQPILDYEKDKNNNLMDTLDTYFRTGGNMKETAKVLFTHYNTIVYRLGKIQALTGTDLSDCDARLNMEIALKLYKIYC